MSREAIQGLRDSVEKTTRALLQYCVREEWAGWDPFDGLNSRLLARMGVLRGRTMRLAVTQAMKRLPVNLRPAFLVAKGETPKACALFCSSLIGLENEGVLSDEQMIRARLARLLELRSPGHSRCCWGYNFDWQSRGFFLPRCQPNIICTTFGGNALLDAFERYPEQAFLEFSTGAAEFLLDGLNPAEGADELCFSYTPFDQSQIHNANLLGAAFVARVFRSTNNPRHEEVARKALRFSLRRQRPDGSWPYGEGEGQEWIDSFHTGYNLVALRLLSDVLDDGEARRSLARGFAFYLDRFFRDGKVAKYYHDREYPIDIHSIAQGIITLCELSDLDSRALAIASGIYTWACQEMRSPKGFFYYQKTRLYTNRIPYMRWSQAWMLRALSILLPRTK
jgi:hypothetical protein